MWEYCINLTTDNIMYAKNLYNNLKKLCDDLGAIITTYESSEYISVLIACEELESVRMKYAINEELIKIISIDFKEKFLEKYLNLNLESEINLLALKRALVNFDKETDVHIIRKYLSIEKSIYLESFFNFKLCSLKAKWQELTKLANENSNYLLSNDTFVELLRFLIDNLEITYDSVNVVYKDGVLKLCDSSFNDIVIDNLSNGNLDDVSFITNLINLCPKHINVYSDEAENSDSLDLMFKIFENRISVLPSNMISAQK